MRASFFKIFAVCSLIFVYSSVALVLALCIKEAIAYKNDPEIAEINRRELEGRAVGGDRIPPIIEEEERNPDGVEDFSLDYEEIDE